MGGSEGSGRAPCRGGSRGGSRREPGGRGVRHARGGPGRRARRGGVEAFRELAGRLLDRIPEEFLRGLDGGIIVLDEVHRDPGAPRGVYTLGEYVVEDPGLGRYILIYYRSFLRLYGHLGPRRVKGELWETILHELRHHLEDLAGVRDLEREDEALLESFRRWAEENR